MYDQSTERISTIMFFLKGLVNRLASVCLYGVLVSIALPWLIPDTWIGDLTSNFPRQTAGIAFLLILFFGVMRAWFRVLVAAAACIASFLVLMEAVPDHSSYRSSATERPAVAMSLLSFNVLYTNDGYRRIADYVADKSPDVAFLSEATSPLLAETDRLAEVYPYRRHSLMTPTGLGLILLSRHPIASFDVVTPQNDGRPFIIARINPEGGTSFTFVGVHPTSPTTISETVRRDAYLAAVSEKVATLAGPVVICGDFNTTPWSSTFKTFVHVTGTTYSPTMPSTWPALLNVAGIPIDHIMVRDMHILSQDSGPSIGSDHLPVSAMLAVPPAASARLVNAEHGTGTSNNF